MRQPKSPSSSSPHRVAILDAARDGRVRRRAVEVYARAAVNWSSAPSEIGRGFRAARELRSPERRFVSEAVYGMVRWRRRLAFALGQAEPTALALYLAWLRREIGPADVLDAELRVAGIDPARLDDAEARIAALPGGEARIAIGESYPDWLVARLSAELGLEDCAKLCAAMNRRAPLTARANRLMNSREELAERLAREGVPSHPSPLAPTGLELETHVNAYGLTAFKEGRFELQDAASQLVAELTAPPPRGSVIDFCAGAGGKTLHLGALLQNRGRILALDVSAPKLEELRERARRAGLTNVRAMTISPEGPLDLPREVGGPADRVLCDAPCSGIGVLRRNPEARWRLQLADLEELPRKQRAILDRSAPLVAVGGRLVYATCTILSDENDAVVDGFLANHPAFEAVSTKEVLSSERALQVGDGERLRLYPHHHDTDGFFAAVLRRKR